MHRKFAAWIFTMAVFLPLAFPSGSARAQQPAAPVAAPRIERFDIDPPTRLVPGEALIFRLTGSSGGKASVEIDGVPSRIALKEVFTGVYEGAYTIKNRDQISFDTVVIGNLRLGNQERSAVLSQALVENSPFAVSQEVPARRTAQ
jgi:hypothetical protein